MEFTHSFRTYDRYMEVFSSNVQEIVPGSFKGNANSEKLLNVHFLFNNITALDNGTFDGLTSVQSFCFTSNRLKTIAVDAFREMKSVTRVELDYNEINELSNGVFHAMTNLGTINITNHQIEVLDGDLFDGNELLQYIYISNNNIIAIGRRYFAGLFQFNEISAYKNRCVDGTFKYREAAKRGLQKCFDNYDFVVSITWN